MRKYRFQFLILAAVLAIVALFFFRPPGAQLKRATVERPKPVAKAATEHAPVTRATSATRNRTVGRASLIGSIKLDKRRACPGEDVQATMEKKAEIAGPVRFSVLNGRGGNPAIVSFDDPGAHLVDIVASDGVGGVDYGSVDLEILAPDSTECAAKTMLFVTARASPVAADTAEIRVTGARNFGKAVRYTYDFGDGTFETSSSPTVTHSYELRAQTEPASSFLIKVQAEDARGNKTIGRVSIAFTNIHWLSRVVGSPVVPAVYDRFAQKRGTSYETDVTFRNVENQPIELATAEVTVETCTGNDPAPKRYPASEVMRGMKVLEPEGTLSATLSIPQAELAGACRVVVELEGDTIPARAGERIGPNAGRVYDPTRARIALDVAAPPLTGALAEAAPVEVANERLAAKLDKAKAILGPNRRVSPEELARLEREGRL